MGQTQLLTKSARLTWMDGKKDWHKIATTVVVITTKWNCSNSGKRCNSHMVFGKLTELTTWPWTARRRRMMTAKSSTLILNFIYIGNHFSLLHLTPPDGHPRYDDKKQDTNTHTNWQTDTASPSPPFFGSKCEWVSACIHTHTHTHTHRERESERRQKTDKQKGRERGRDKGTSWRWWTDRRRALYKDRDCYVLDLYVCVCHFSSFAFGAVAGGMAATLEATMRHSLSLAHTHTLLSLSHSWGSFFLGQLML